MCTGGILVVRENLVDLSENYDGWKFEYFLLSYNEKRVDSMRIHHMWEPVHY
jgi:hypothetical protein